MFSTAMWFEFYDKFIVFLFKFHNWTYHTFSRFWTYCTNGFPCCQNVCLRCVLFSLKFSFLGVPKRICRMKGYTARMFHIVQKTGKCFWLWPLYSIIAYHDYIFNPLEKLEVFLSALHTSPCFDSDEHLLSDIVSIYIHIL